jgi:N-acetylglutamate synthase-like GNAT family acetyltransferase
VSIFNLTKEPEHIPTLAEWHHAEWSYLNPGGSVQLRIEKMQTYLGNELIPTTYIYKQKKALAGSASIVKHDMQSRLELSPWLASVFIAPQFRNLGIGSELVRHVMQMTREAGIKKLYLFTPDQEQFYEKFGWTTLSREEYHDTPVTVMEVAF